MNRIREIRKLRSMTQSELGAKLNCARSTIAMWESEKSFPDPESLLKLSEILKVSIDYLLGKSGDSNLAPPEEHTKINFQLFGPNNPYDQLSPEGKAKVDEYILFIKQQEEKAKQND